MYPIMVVFIRTFVNGPLKGIQVDGSLGFCEMTSAQRWVASITAKGLAGELDYQITEVRYLSN